MDGGTDERAAKIREIVARLLRGSKALLDAADLLLQLAEVMPDAPARPIAEPEQETEPGAVPVNAVAAAEKLQLTPRESQVIEMLGDGRTNRQIARALGISDNTVRSHLQSVYRKLGAGHRTEAVLLAQRAGILRTLPW